MRPGMRHPPPVQPLRPPQRLMPVPMDGGVFFGGRDYTRRQQQQQAPNYPPQKPLLPPGTPPQPWQNNPNFRPGPMPLLRPGGPWHPHGNNYHSPSPPPPPPLLHPHQTFNPNAQTPITYVPPHQPNYELMRLANVDQIPFLEPHEDEDELVRQHLAANNSNIDESLILSNSSPSKPNKRRRQQQQQQQQHENNRNVVSYQDLDRPEEQRDPSFDNRPVPKSNKTNLLPTDKTNNHYPSKSATDDTALKLELDRIKKAGAQERERLKAQRQAAAEKEAQMKKNSAKTGDKEKREDGELGDSSDDENGKSSAPTIEQRRLKKIVDNLALQPAKSATGSSHRSKTPPSESILDMNIMAITRPLKLFHLDDEKASAYREYLTSNFGRVRVHCHKPQPNFFSNVSCIEEIKRRLRLNNNASSTLLFRHLLDDNDEDLINAIALNTEPEDGEIESEDENTPMEVNGKALKPKSLHQLSDDDTDKQVRKKSKLNDDGTGDLSKSSLSEKPWITTELRMLIKQRNKLQAQILSGDTNTDVEKKFKKMRNKISKHAKTLKAKYENSFSGSNEPSLAPPASIQSLSSSAAASAVNHPLSTILDPTLVMAMLVNPTLYSHVQQQVLSNPNFMQAYQHMFAEGAGQLTGSSKSSTSQPSKVASETQVVPSTTNTAALDEVMKQAIAPKSNKEQQSAATARSRPVLTQATKPIQLTSLESDVTDPEQRNKSNQQNKTRLNSSETPLTESQQQDIALIQESIRRQAALTQQQQQLRNLRNPHAASQLSLSAPLSRHIPLTTEQMQEVLTRAKNYITRQQTDEITDSNNNQPRLSFNARRLQASLAASASSATPPTAHTIGQAAAAAIAAVSARPSSTTTTRTATSTPPSSVPPPGPPPQTAPLARPPLSSNPVGGPPPPPPGTVSMPPAGPQQHPIRIQLDQKSKTLSSISNKQSLPIPTINQQKIMPLIDMNPPVPQHMYPNPPNWQRPPHMGGPHYPMGPPPSQQHPPPPQHYPPYENPHGPPYYGPRMNYPPDMRPPHNYGPPPPRHLSQPPRYNGPMPQPGPYGYGHPVQNYGPGVPPPPHPHYGHPYPPS